MQAPSDAYNLTPSFILETVEVARDFVLGIAKSSRRNVTPTSPTGGPALAAEIAAFLAWPKERVSQSLAQLHAFDDEEAPLSRKAVEQLPTIHSATVLHREVKSAARAGKAIPEKKQIEIAKKAAERR